MPDNNRPATLFEILFEDTDLLVVNKPAGLVCHPTKGDVYSSLISRARLYLEGLEPLNLPEPLPPLPSQQETIPPAALPPTLSCHMVNRLDRETSGVTLLAKNSATAGELGKIWERRGVEKEYLAIVHGTMIEKQGCVEFPLGKDEQSRVSIKDCVRPDGVVARTDYVVERYFRRGDEDFTLVRVKPHSGRKHQIRIHMAALGHSIVGDKLYGGDEDLYLALVQDRLTPQQRSRLLLNNQGLHACSLRFTWRGKEHHYSAPPDAEFKAFIGEA